MKQTDGNIWNNTDELLKHVESKIERRWNDHTLPFAIPKFQHSTCCRRRKCFLEEGDAGDREEDDVRRRRLLGSRVDAPQKPNCRSPEQGPERQGLRRHLPSRSFVRAELRDEESYRATELRFWNMFSLFIWSWKNCKGSRDSLKSFAGTRLQQASPLFEAYKSHFYIFHECLGITQVP